MGERAGWGRRPFVTAVVTAVLSLGLLLAAVRHGWLGPDVDRGSQFCEAEHAGLLRQPVNSLSNVGFVVAGLAIGWRAGRPSGRLARPGLGTFMAVLVTLLGPASMAMHATESDLGGHLDMLSMYLVASFAASYALVRWLGGGSALAGALFVGLVLLCVAVERGVGSFPVPGHAGNTAFGLLLVVAATVEVGPLRGRRRDLRWGYAAVGVMLLALAIWWLSWDGRPLCDPSSVLQGHAAWHLLCALAAYCLYRLYVSEDRG